LNQIKAERFFLISDRDARQLNLHEALLHFLYGSGGNLSTNKRCSRSSFAWRYDVSSE
jgi:hypothetical protein